MPHKGQQCQAEACDLQSCLTKHTYQPEKCDEHVRKLYECCKKMYEVSPDSESTACPVPKVIHKWLRYHPK